MSRLDIDFIDGLVQDCSNSSALAMELLQSCTKPSIFTTMFLAGHVGSREQMSWSNALRPLQ